MGSSCCLHRNLIFYRNDELHRDLHVPLEKKKKLKKRRFEVKNLKEILFGHAVCVNGPTVNKIIQEPFVVTLNSKTEEKNCITPSRFSKNAKN